MKVGLQFEACTPDPEISFSRRYDEMFSLIAHGQDHGYDGVWIAERHLGDFGFTPNPLMLLARASEIAPSLRLGTAMLELPLWHPVRLAEDIAALDVMSAGRVELGIDGGSRGHESASLDTGARIGCDRSDESLTIMLQAFAQDAVGHCGRFWDVPETLVVPKPLQRPHPPIWTTITDLGSVRAAVARGYHVSTGTGELPEQLAERHLLIDEVARELGRPIDQVQRAVSRFVLCTDDPRETREAVERSRWQFSGARPADDDDHVHGDSWQRCTIIGDPDECMQRLGALAAAGTSYLQAQFVFGGIDSDVARRSAERFSRDVMPMAAELRTTYSEP